MSRDLTPERLAQIAALLDEPRGITTDRERDLHTAARDLLAELRRRTPRKAACPEHPGQPSGRCRPCADQRATPEQIRAARARAAELMSRPSTPEEDQ